MGDELNGICGDVVDYLIENLSVQLQRIVDRCEASPQETELALLALYYGVMGESEDIEFLTDNR